MSKDEAQLQVSVGTTCDALEVCRSSAQIWELAVGRM